MSDAAKTIAKYFRSRRGDEDEDKEKDIHKKAKEGALKAILSKSLSARFKKGK